MLANIAVFKVVFLGILLEGVPFILLGSLISSLINELVSEETIKKIIPKSPFLGIIVASFVGLIFPVCECAIVPIVRRLMKKGVPIYIAIPLMISVPIINPIVLFSTYTAFSSMTYMVWLRAIFGLIVAWSIGLLLYILYKNDTSMLLKNPTTQSSCGHDHGHDHIVQIQLTPVKKKIPYRSIIQHTSSEFYDIGKLLIIGAFISALFKSFVPMEVIEGLSSNNFTSIIIMMIFAFVLSLCSEVDAFIARSYIGLLPANSILAFLVLGPMIDIKNFIMLRGTFEKKFVLRITTLMFIFVFILTAAVNFI